MIFGKNMLSTIGPHNQRTRNGTDVPSISIICTGACQKNESNQD